MRIGNVAKFFAVTVLAGQAIAQTSLVGFTAAGKMIEIDATTGEGTLIADLGMPIVGATNTGARTVWALRADGAIIGADPATGAWSIVSEPAGLPAGGEPVAVDLGRVIGSGTRPRSVFVIVRSPTKPDELYRLSLGGDAYKYVGSCGVTGLVGLSDWGSAISADGKFHMVDYETGEARPDWSYPIAEPAGCFHAGNSSNWTAGSTLWRLGYTPSPGATPIGLIGFDRLAGLCAMPPSIPCFEYADCDGYTPGAGTRPDIFDFLCWQDRFVKGDPYACDCDVSTGFGMCDVFDFLCYQNVFVRASGGC